MRKKIPKYIAEQSNKDVGNFIPEFSVTGLLWSAASDICDRNFLCFLPQCIYQTINQCCRTSSCACFHTLKNLAFYNFVTYFYKWYIITGAKFAVTRFSFLVHVVYSKQKTRPTKTTLKYGRSAICIFQDCPSCPNHMSKYVQPLHYAQYRFTMPKHLLEKTFFNSCDVILCLLVFSVLAASCNRRVILKYFASVNNLHLFPYPKIYLWQIYSNLDWQASSSLYCFRNEII